MKIPPNSFWVKFRLSKQFPHLKTKRSNTRIALRILKSIFMCGICAHEFPSVCMWKSETRIRCLPLLLSTPPPPFESVSLIEPRGHWVQLDWLASKPMGSSSFYLPSAWLFIWGFRSGLGFSSLHSKYFTYWIIFSALAQESDHLEASLSWPETTKLENLSAWGRHLHSPPAHVRQKWWHRVIRLPNLSGN